MSELDKSFGTDAARAIRLAVLVVPTGSLACFQMCATNIRVDSQRESGTCNISHHKTACLLVLDDVSSLPLHQHGIAHVNTTFIIPPCK